MRIHCKTKDCPGEVEYTPQVAQLLQAFQIALKTNKISPADEMDHDKFSTVVKSVVDDSDNVFTNTKTAYLTCDYTGEGGPHTNAYQVPAK